MAGTLFARLRQHSERTARARPRIHRAPTSPRACDHMCHPNWPLRPVSTPVVCPFASTSAAPEMADPPCSMYTRPWQTRAGMPLALRSAASSTACSVQSPEAERAVSEAEAYAVDKCLLSIKLCT
eukprot:6206225-Pleurochrysis_carterae.AAC.1